MNPYLPSYEYIPDGEPRVFGSRLYIYGSHDCFNGSAYCQNDYVLWSAPVGNLSSWKKEGVIWRREQDGVTENPSSHRLFAPDCVEGPDGRYYLYYSFDFTGVIGVAVADSPTGPFEYLGHVRHSDGTLLGKKRGDHFQYDPAVLVDGTSVYLYSGFCPQGKGAERFNLGKWKPEGCMVWSLESDMITLKSEEERYVLPSSASSEGTAFFNHAFFEAPSVRKYDDLYYLVYSSEHGHELCHAVSSSPDRNFTYAGILLSNADIGFEGNQKPLNHPATNHGGLLRIGERFFIFYHRNTSRVPWSRQGCAELLTRCSDGHFLQSGMTSQGLSASPLPGKGWYPASCCYLLTGKDGTASSYSVGEKIREDEPYLIQSGVDRECDPDQYVAGLSDCSCAGFRYFDVSETEGITVEVKTTGKGVFIITFGEDVLCSIDAPESESWIRLRSPVRFNRKVSGIYIYWKGEGEASLNGFLLE